MSTPAGRAEMTARIINELIRDKESTPAISYEVRGDDLPRRLEFDGNRERGVLAEEGADPWRTACIMADLMSGQWCTTVTIWQVRTYANLRGEKIRTEESRIVSSCGGSQHWADPDDDGHLHQIGSPGFCWTCLHPDHDLGQERHGLIRHPVTPAEIGQPGYRCFVCGAEGRDPENGHSDVDHTVIWGEELHPRCEVCGLAHQTATPEGIGYEPHAKGCPALNPGYVPKEAGQ